MGILAVIFNGIAVTKGITSLNKLRNRTSSLLVFYNKTLVCLIEFGDFLVGTYLVMLSVYDSWIFGDDYCRSQPEWLTGTPCLVLGVISTIGSQISVFAMTVLSIVRVVGVYKRFITNPLRIGWQPYFYAGLLALIIIAVSSTIALIPLLPSLEDYFIQGMYYDPAYKIFIGFPNKNRHINVLRAYYNSTSLITSDISWSDIGKKVDDMFTQDYGNLTRRPVHFYGNDGVCLFKYFVRTDDARRSRQSPGSGAKMSDPVAWTMLTLNFSCFVVMISSYIALLINQRKGSVNPHGSNKRAKLQLKIFIILLTDFLCWVPFIIISAFHNLEVLDATEWYVSFAMIVLPLNSVINPLIYDESIKQCFVDAYSYLQRNVTRLVQLWGFRRAAENYTEQFQMPKSKNFFTYLDS